jgi:hypothetical protein
MSKGQQQLLQAALVARRRTVAPSSEDADRRNSENAQPTPIGQIAPRAQASVEPRTALSTERADSSVGKRIPRHSDDELDLAGPLSSQSPSRQRPPPSHPHTPTADWHKTEIRNALSELFETVRVGQENIVVFGSKGVLQTADEEACVAMIKYQLKQHNLTGEVSVGNRAGRYRVTYVEE